MRADRARGTIRASLLLATSALALLAVVAFAAALCAADPPDTTAAPTEDWVFDSGTTVDLDGKSWTVGYNITVTNGTSLSIGSCAWTMDSAAGTGPVWILVDLGSSLNIDTSTLSSPEGSGGFYIVTYGDLTVTTSQLTGLVPDPTGLGGIVALDASVTFHTVTVSDAAGAAALYAHNSTVILSYSTFRDIAGDAVMSHLTGGTDGMAINISVDDSSFSRVGGSALRVTTDTFRAASWIDVFQVTMDNVTAAGVSVVQGDGTSTDGGTGSIHLRVDTVDIADVGGAAVSLTSTYQQTSQFGMGTFEVTVVDCEIARALGGGVYALVKDSDIAFGLAVEACTVRDIARGVASAGMPGIYFEYGSFVTNPPTILGQANMTVGNTTLRGCDWGGLEELGNLDWLRVINVSMLDNKVYGMYDWSPNYYGYMTPVRIEGCRFVGNDGYGLLVENRYYTKMGQVIDVIDCEFADNAGGAIAMHVTGYIQTTAPITIGFNVSGCSIEGGGSAASAIEVTLDRLVGTLVLDVTSTRINGTGGIRTGGGGTLADNQRTLIQMTDVELLNCTRSAIEVSASALTKIFVNITLADVDAVCLEGDALSVGNNAPNQKATDVGVDLTVRDCRLEAMNGTALVLMTNAKHLPSPTTFLVEGSTLIGSTRGLVVRGHDGIMRDCKVQSGLLEDVLAIDTVADLWHVELSGAVEDKVQVLTRGEVRLYYDLSVTVTWSTGTPAVQSTVWVRDNSLTTVLIQRLTSPDATLEGLVLNPYIIQPAGAVSRNPYIVNASFFGVSQSVGVVLDSDKQLTVVLRDNVAPEVEILVPDDGTVQQSSVVRVTGTAWDHESGLAAVRVSIDGENWTEVESTGSWSARFDVDNATIARTDGRLTVRAVAVDVAGNTATDAIAVRIVQRPPGIEVHAPADGIVTNEADLRVYGTTDEGASILVNGLPVPVTDTLFDCRITLVEGENTVTVVSTDELGNTNVVRLRVVLDTRQPFLVLESPTEDATVNVGSTVLKARLEGDLRVTVAGAEVPYGSEWYPVGEGTMSYTVHLQPGENDIAVVAVDPAGNVLTVSRRVFLDTEPPWIVVDSPAAGALLTMHDVVVVGTVDPAATLRLNGQPITTTGGTFSVPILASEGLNTITLWALDAAGNERTVTVDFTVDTSLPRIKVTNPPTGDATVSRARLDIEGTVLHDGQVTAVSLLLDGSDHVTVKDASGIPQLVLLAIDPTEGTFSIPYDLLEGMNELTLVALDAAGNRATVVLRVVLDTVAPVLTATVEPSLANGGGGSLTTWSQGIVIEGSAEPGCVLMLGATRIPVMSNGSYSVHYWLPGEGARQLVLTATDGAGNVRQVLVNVTYEVGAGTDGGGEDGGSSTALLVAAVVVLVVCIVVAAMLALRGAEGPRGGQDGADVEEGDGETGPGAAEGGGPARGKGPKGKEAK
jgi:hypothetical protein